MSENLRLFSTKRLSNSHVSTTAKPAKSGNKSNLFLDDDDDFFGGGGTGRKAGSVTGGGPAATASRPPAADADADDADDVDNADNADGDDSVAAAGSTGKPNAQIEPPVIISSQVVPSAQPKPPATAATTTTTTATTTTPVAAAAAPAAAETTRRESLPLPQSARTPPALSPPATPSRQSILADLQSSLFDDSDLIPAKRSSKPAAASKPQTSTSSSSSSSFTSVTATSNAAPFAYTFASVSVDSQPKPEANGGRTLGAPPPSSKTAPTIDVSRQAPPLPEGATAAAAAFDMELVPSALVTESPTTIEDDYVCDPVSDDPLEASALSTSSSTLEPSVVVTDPILPPAVNEPVPLLPASPLPATAAPQAASSNLAPTYTFKSRGELLTREMWLAMLADGRVMNESGLRSAVFCGGIDPQLRAEIWPLLLGMYPMQSTLVEREILRQEKHAQYYAMRRRCLRVLAELGLGQDSQYLSTAAEVASGVPEDPSLAVLADINANSKPFDQNKLRRAQSQIDKDVPRTEREHPYFAGPNGVQGAQKLRHILLTFAAFRSQLGYVQGMSDILAMLLVVLDNEADAYWCFVGYMHDVEYDFQEAGMSWKLQRMSALLQFMDHDLFAQLHRNEAHELVFMHRWLLLSFRREFRFDQAVQMFEVLISRHLGKATIAHPSVVLQGRVPAAAVTSKTSAGAKRGGASAPTSVGRPNTSSSVFTSNKTGSDNHDHRHFVYTFELFVALAIIEGQRSKFLACHDQTEVFLLANSLATRLDLEITLANAERLFLAYRERTTRQRPDLWDFVDEKDDSVYTA
ncbi:hypothetical protein CAOG_01140 [Capsaspora owczarzaki ATCC 30864]|uniref:Rab-GAP TBC domain-containing protein n=1 Tax=Capsaspora owczarzaki (strain ATCC 30864) TaxID=595528 RepID=A0A0D2X0V3_CAPO3|nr:hypothetical protein CAOG_01140 [Capsaspora owczarzaki ATCC 30864]KJE89709.1 hypothetical protein CAOG_001140 [Capsaspora owczarzaki ATCC 30864]|eukprot:XP_004366011.1 hypothetical protein CAOG_01140 [Capsaspora owczarzaki ATCC 30864]